MGLDTSHDCWHGPYSSFNRWRNEVAVAAGYAISDFWYVGVNYDSLLATSPDFLGEWPEGYDIGDPLLYLLAHSDCDGVIHPREGRLLADRLDALLPVLADSEVPGPRGTSVFAATEQFIAGLRDAAAAGEDVDFH